MSYNVLMFGWEFPPHNSGGLGVACKGLAKALARAGCNITFVLPEKMPVSDPDLSFEFADVSRNSGNVLELLSEGAYKKPGFTGDSKANNSEPDTNREVELSLIESVRLYGKQARSIARQNDFDVVHAHDWLSYLAGITAKKESGRPLVSHIHATELDRTGGQGANQDVFSIEKQGFQEADHVLSVSQFTKDILTDKYGVKEERVTPAHNGIEATPPDSLPPVLKRWKDRGNKVVLFLGRQTIQKGPDHFLKAAKRLLSERQDILFVMAGSGDMQEELIELSAQLGIADKVLFPGFVRGDKVDQLYQSADLYVLPSVSEPFGITPLESLLNRTPVLISNQSGVSETLDHALTVDFWDTDAMAHKMDATLRYPVLSETLTRNGHEEVLNLTWDRTAEVCLECYNNVTT